MAKRGLFIVFEGIDGSGKDTHIKLLSEELRQQGHSVLETAEPSGNEVGALLRRYQRKSGKRLPAETEALLYTADRYEHIRNIVEPALKKGQIVLSNRYFYSTLAYQGAMGIDLDWIREMNRFAPKPDAAILLDILPEFSLRRLRRQKTVFEQLENLRKVRDIYVRLVKGGELVRVDADRPKRVVQADLLALVQELLKSRDDG